MFELEGEAAAVIVEEGLRGLEHGAGDEEVEGLAGGVDLQELERADAEVDGDGGQSLLEPDGGLEGLADRGERSGESSEGCEGHCVPFPAASCARGGPHNGGARRAALWRSSAPMLPRLSGRQGPASFPSRRGGNGRHRRKSWAVRTPRVVRERDRPGGRARAGEERSERQGARPVRPSGSLLVNGSPKVGADKPAEVAVVRGELGRGSQR